MMSDSQLILGDICRDPSGLRVRVEDVDTYDYVHFSVIEDSKSDEDKEKSGQTSHVAFAHRLTILSRSSTIQKS